MAISMPDQLEDIDVSDELRVIKDRVTELATDATELAKAQATAMAADSEDVMQDVSEWARRPSTRTAAKYLAIGALVGALIAAFFMRRRKKRAEAEDTTEEATRPTPIPQRDDAQAS